MGRAKTRLDGGLVANGGGVISSYYEWVQNHQRVRWAASDERGQVLDRLQATVAAAEPAMWRTKALGVGIVRVAEALRLSGAVT